MESSVEIVMAINSLAFEDSDMLMNFFNFACFILIIPKWWLNLVSFDFLIMVRFLAEAKSNQNCDQNLIFCLHPRIEI